MITIEGFERQEEDRFVWYSDRNKESVATILGWININNKDLVLETNSKERLEKGKAIILKSISDSVAHKTDVFQDIYQAMEEEEERKPVKRSRQETEEIPLEIQQEIITQFLNKQYENWPNEHLPALNGKTPSEAVKTKAGKEKVIDLLKSFENMEERKRKQGKPYYNFSWLWERLGLEKP